MTVLVNLTLVGGKYQLNIGMNVRHYINLVEAANSPLHENLYRTVADEADTEIHNAVDQRAGHVGIETLSQKSQHPNLFDWPELEDEDRIIILTGLEANVKGQGFGRNAMTTICDIADRRGCTIVLDANSYGSGGMSDGKLIEFYRSFGFEYFTELKDYMNYPMVRYPD